MLGDNHDLNLTHISETGGLEENRNFVLGLRSSRPPDSVSSSKANPGKPPKRDKEEQPELSDAEWDIRTGRSILSISTSNNANFWKFLVRKSAVCIARDPSRILQNWTSD